MESLLWERVGELADRAPRISDLRYHKLHLLAAARLRQRGDDVPGASSGTLSATRPQSRSAVSRCSAASGTRPTNRSS